MRITRKEAWTTAFLIAAVQLSVAVFAVYSSSQDILSDGACIGGIFGSLANAGILLIASVWLIVLIIKSIRTKTRHPLLQHLCLVLASSGLAILIGMQAALRCTV